MTKTNYDQLENFKRIEQKIQKSSANTTAVFDHKYMEINYEPIQQQKNF